ncbi:SRPBCC family protein [Nocardioides sp. MAH-18]|uniref:SRPBCC family protein n=1 Tax=Nocardioides agri TaxID=2682843 RepID=A0A6L6XVZ6_9ACTN|nr:MULTISPECIES: SRPBCC family protein [unclassified Nocardioides]MBA2956395.1 SRPBCC family protein [Nocardioides sp. CGMCC 1.13656]MVQ51238.1 SRPBCC family protein [Nocardioides sp. MAH-18]
MSDPGRELRAEAEVAAPPAAVWSLLTDLSRMPEWSPELVRMVPLKRGGLRVGQWYLGINRRKGVVWPTRNVVALLEPGRVLAWDTTSSGARWIWELAPAGPEGASTRVVHRRPVPGRLTRSSRIFAPLALGGGAGHADELEAGMAQTVARLRAAAEG